MPKVKGERVVHFMSTVALLAVGVGVIALLLVAFIVVEGQRGGVQPSPTAPSAAARNQLWIEDINELVTRFPQLQKDGPALTAAAGWSAAADQVKADVPHLTDAQIETRLMAMVARLGIAHDTLTAPDLTTATYPLAFIWLADGPLVIAAQDADLVGAQLVSIDGHTTAELLAALTTVISHENQQWLLVQAANYLSFPRLLQALGMAHDPASAAFVFAINGQQVTRTIQAGGVITHQLPNLPSFVLPADTVFTSSLLPDGHTVLVEYERCTPSPELDTFTAHLTAYLAQHHVDRMVIDLRRNMGGDSSVLEPFIQAVARSPLNAPGRLYVAIGRQTFSSALLNAIELRQTTAAQLIGEPTGGSPNSYGEVRQLSFGHHGLSVSYTISYFSDGAPGATTLSPGIDVPTTSADLLHGVDKVLAELEQQG